MINSSHRDRRTRAIAEVLAMMATIEPVSQRSCAIREIGDSLWQESSTGFSAASDRYCAARNMRIKRKMH